MTRNNNGASAGGWLDDMDSQPSGAHLEIAVSGSTSERWRLSGREDLSREAFEALVKHSDEVVAGSLAQNYATPPDLLDQLAQRYPDLHEIIATNPNASADLKETTPLGSHSQDSINRFLDAKNATMEERRKLIALYEAGPHPGGPLLSSVWARVHST